jgi:hypothetical protein
MGFWSGVESTVVSGAAGAVGAAEVVPAVGPYANAGAAAIHAVDGAAHEIAGGYDALTGDDKGAEEQFQEGAAQGTDALAAAIPKVGLAAAGADLLGAGYDATMTGARAAGASDEEAPMAPSIGSSIIGGAMKLFGMGGDEEGGGG